jgi:hypothetical protein
LLYIVVDSVSPGAYDTLEYNSNKKLIKFHTPFGGGSGNNGYVDTFIYDNNSLIKSQYNLGKLIKFATPYSKTEYVYQNNVLVSSKYYLGNTNLITSSVYTFDNLGRLSQVTQSQINTSAGASPTYTTRFEYDSKSNLSKIYFRQSPYPEYMLKEFLNYDSKENPYYNLPWIFDYNIFEWNAEKLSKNNVGKINTFTSFQGSVPVLQGTVTYTYEYFANGKVSKSKGPYGTKYFHYY